MNASTPEPHDPVDPRVQVELERLNSATDAINRLEVDLDEARSSFRGMVCESTVRLEAVRARLKGHVERCRPYYEARFRSSETFRRTQEAAARFERANSAHCAAREMVYLAEQGLGGRTLDPAWQEMLNHATQRVNEAEAERSTAAADHQVACANHETTTAKVATLQKDLKRAIARSSMSIRRNLLQINNIFYKHELLLLPYYEMKAHFNHLLEKQRLKIQLMESNICKSKLTYAEALKNLEQISDEIHRTRSRTLGVLKAVNGNGEPQPQEAALLPADESEDEYKDLPATLVLASPTTNEEIADKGDEWTDISLDTTPCSENAKDLAQVNGKAKQNNASSDEEIVSCKPRTKLDLSISNWITRSSAKNDNDSIFDGGRRQSLDSILAPTSEKVKEILSQGMMKLNISSLMERRNSLPQTEDKSKIKKIPSPLEKNYTYLTAEDDNSDAESVSSVDMLNEDQISSLMFDRDLNAACEEILGSPIAKICPAAVGDTNPTSQPAK